MAAIILTSLLVAPFTGWALLRLTGLSHGWPWPALVAFTPYAAALSALPLALAVALGRWPVAVVAAATTLALAACVLPRASGPPDRPADGPRIRVLTSNLLFGGADPEQLLDLVRTRNVDLLALQEYTPEAEKALRLAGIAQLLPHRVTHPRDESGGSALYSRFQLTDPGYRPLPPYFGQTQATLHVPGAAPVLVESVHPAAPSHRTGLTHWRTGLAAQPRPTPDGPARILLGDFNATLDHAPLRRLLRAGYRDAGAVLGAGLVGTWPYDGTRVPKVTIDHVLVDPRLRVHGLRAYRLTGSDHRALLAELSVPPLR